MSEAGAGTDTSPPSALGKMLGERKASELCIRSYKPDRLAANLHVGYALYLIGEIVAHIHCRVLTAGHRAAKPGPNRADKRGDWFLTGAGVPGLLTRQRWAQPEAVNFSAFRVAASWPRCSWISTASRLVNMQGVLDVDGRALMLLPAMFPFPLFSLT